MDETIQKMLDTQDQLRSNPEFSSLQAEYRQRSEDFMRILEQLSSVQRDGILDFFGVCIEIHLRLLKTACQAAIPDDRNKPENP